MPESPPKSHDDLLPPPDIQAHNTFPLRPLAAFQRSTVVACPSSYDTTSSNIIRRDLAASPQDPGLETGELATSSSFHGTSPGHEFEQLLTDPEANTEIAGEQRGPMSKAPLLHPSSAGFETGSYGAAPMNPVIDDNGDTNEDFSELPGRHAPGAEDTRHRRRKSGSTTRSDGLGRTSTSSIRPRQQSEEIGGSTVAGGVDGRFGLTEMSLANDTLSDVKSDASSTDGEGGSDEDCASDMGNDNDPPDNSPYAQVRASVAPTDNTTLSISTPRMWILSTLFAILGSSTNLFFSLRYPSVAITPVIALLLVHPLGLLWDLLLKQHDDPPEEFIDGVRVSVPNPGFPSDHGSAPRKQMSRAQRLRLWLAQGTWNEKEHSCVYVSSNVSFGFAFATDVIVEQTQFYKQDASIVYQLLLTLSTQILGYAFAGLTRRFLVRPSGMIWPGTLMSAAMFTTLHKEENKPANGWRISRWKFFYVVFLGSFLFYFVPGLLMPALSYFNVITWFAPDNVVVANLFGVVSGLGLFPLTFDWAQIAYIGSPLLTPFWAAMNVVGGLVIVMWIIAPISYYANLFHSSYMPMLSASVFDNTGSVYDVSRILTSDFVFDKEAYSSYSKVFLPITYVLSYGLQFAGLASLLTHTACWHGKDIWNQWTKSLKEVKEEGKPAYQPLSTESNGLSPISPVFRSNGPGLALRRSNSNFDDLLSREDVHNRLMRQYKDAPLTWYLLTAVTMTGIGIFVVEYYPIHLPWYGLFLALGICSVLFIPIGIVMAVTNQQSSIYLICQLIAGVVFPGRPLANMVFVTYGYISSAQGIKFAADLKLGHYMKIPPRILFKVQMAATVVSSFTQISVLNWMFQNIPGLCTSEAINGFTCPIARVHFNGSILWGVVGPAEFFGPNATYRPLIWGFLIGAIAPIPLWLIGRGKKNSIIRKINLPVLFGSLSWIPPATGLNFSVWALVCYVFNYLIKRRYHDWWAKYTMTLSASLDSGLAVGIVVVFFGFVFPGWMDGFSWWGTEIYKLGCDWQACAFNKVANGSHFGPDEW
ncbi:sexual differentiation process protein isp4 [Xylariales sp. AK1849]|nr:sexual differentiation process protein isp4 [Xylariales sp. AK1849]